MSAIVETCLYLVGTRTHPHLPVCQDHHWNISGQGTNEQRHSPSHCQTCCLQTSWAQSHPRIQPCPAVGLGPSPVHKLFNKPTSTHSIHQLDSTSLRMPWPSTLHTTRPKPALGPLGRTDRGTRMWLHTAAGRPRPQDIWSSTDCSIRTQTTC